LFRIALSWNDPYLLIADMICFLFAGGLSLLGLPSGEVVKPFGRFGDASIGNCFRENKIQASLWSLRSNFGPSQRQNVMQTVSAALMILSMRTLNLKSAGHTGMA
jgi:hypothetical protein